MDRFDLTIHIAIAHSKTLIQQLECGMGRTTRNAGRCLSLTLSLTVSVIHNSDSNSVECLSWYTPTFRILNPLFGTPAVGTLGVGTPGVKTPGVGTPGVGTPGVVYR